MFLFSRCTTNRTPIVLSQNFDDDNSRKKTGTSLVLHDRKYGRSVFGYFVCVRSSSAEHKCLRSENEPNARHTLSWSYRACCHCAWQRWIHFNRIIHNIRFLAQQSYGICHDVIIFCPCIERKKRFSAFLLTYTYLAKRTNRLIKKIVVKEIRDCRRSIEYCSPRQQQ